MLFDTMVSWQLIILAHSVGMEGLNLDCLYFLTGIVRGARVLSAETTAGAPDHGKSGRDY